MNVELFAACDFAQDNSGKLTVVGCFDTINTRALPAKHPFMSVAARLRFMIHELGKHRIRLVFKDPEGGMVVPPFEGEIDISNLGTDTSSFSFVLNNVGIEFKNAGKHEISLFVDDKPISSIPLYVRKA
jgi:hypothetical protein